MLDVFLKCYITTIDDGIHIKVIQTISLKILMITDKEHSIVFELNLFVFLWDVRICFILKKHVGGLH